MPPPKKAQAGNSANPTATPTKFRIREFAQGSFSAASSSELTPGNIVNVSGASSTLGLTPNLGMSSTAGQNPFQSPGMPTTSTPLSSVLSTSTTRADRMRMWRHDALQQHLYETAAFWGDKVVALTGDPNDVFWLAQVHFQTGHYTRAEKLLLHKKLLDSSVACRELAAQCSIKLEKWQEALEILGEDNPFAKGVSQVKNMDGGIKLEASMCYLRGLVYSKQNNIERAKGCYKEALLLDIKCFAAFEALVGNHMMTNGEEWLFITSLKFEEQCPEDSEFIRSLYITKLKKYAHTEEIEAAQTRLETKYNLKENPDVLFGRAEAAFTQCRFQECYEVTSNILKIDQYNPLCLPTHLACLYELGLKNELFYLSHELVDRYPEMAVTWFGVGVYYYLIGKNAEARRYFSKASTMDPQFGAAWLGFGHSFAMDGEHDQAISAYSTSARLFQGTHLPTLFIGMHHLQLNNNMSSAEEYLLASFRICEDDPLLLNELGLLYYNKAEYVTAEKYMLRALEIARDTRCKKNVIWETAYCNIGHLYRRMGRYDEALSQFEKVLVLNPQNASAYAAIGWIRQLRGETDEAIVCYHQALSLNPSDTYASEMLQHALDDLKNRPLFPGLPDELQDGKMSDDNELAAEIYGSQQHNTPTSTTASTSLIRQPFGGYQPGGSRAYISSGLGSGGSGMEEDGMYHDEEDEQIGMDIYEDEDEVDQGLGSGGVSFGQL